MDYSVVKKAGLSQTEFAMLCGVSRVTTNLWIRGKMKPNRHIADKVKSRLALVGYAVEAGLLPAERERDKTKRHDQLVQLLAEAAKAKKEALAVEP